MPGPGEQRQRGDRRPPQRERARGAAARRRRSSAPGTSRRARAENASTATAPSSAGQPEPGERPADPVAVAVDRQAEGGRPQRGADAEGGDQRAGGDDPGPGRVPRAVWCECRHSKATARMIRPNSTSTNGR